MTNQDLPGLQLLYYVFLWKSRTGGNTICSMYDWNICQHFPIDSSQAVSHILVVGVSFLGGFGSW